MPEDSLPERVCAASSAAAPGCTGVCVCGWVAVYSISSSLLLVTLYRTPKVAEYVAR